MLDILLIYKCKNWKYNLNNFDFGADGGAKEIYYYFYDYMSQCRLESSVVSNQTSEIKICKYNNGHSFLNSFTLKYSKIQWLTLGYIRLDVPHADRHLNIADKPF